MQKVFVLGLDGAVLDFINRPELPNFQKVLQSSAYGTSFSRPALTPAAWTSMTTGVNPLLPKTAVIWKKVWRSFITLGLSRAAI